MSSFVWDIYVGENATIQKILTTGMKSHIQSGSTVTAKNFNKLNFIALNKKKIL